MAVLHLKGFVLSLIFVVKMKSLSNFGQVKLVRFG